MKENKTEQIQAVFAMMNEYNYVQSETAYRRVCRYDFQKDTELIRCDEYIQIRTETAISGVYNVLTLYRNGDSKWRFEVNKKVLEA